MAQTIQRRRRGRDWRDPFDWFLWAQPLLRGSALYASEPRVSEDVIGRMAEDGTLRQTEGY